MTETHEDPSHCVAVKGLVTVEDQSISAELRSQSLDRLGLTCTSWPEWGSSESPVQGLRQSQIASIGQGCLDELLSHTKILEAIEELAICNLDLELLQGVLLLVVEVEPHMVQPSKLIDGLDLLEDQLACDILLMYQVCDQLLVLLPDILSKIGEHTLCEHLENRLRSLFDKDERL